MKRTKEWWARLTAEERSELMRLEKSMHWRQERLEGGYSWCTGCGDLISGSGLCVNCYSDLVELKAKGDGDPI